MNKLSEKENLMTKVFNWLIILYLYYYSYRYILQYNSENTSPTYSNTPAVIQLFKYCCIVGIVFLLVVFSNDTLKTFRGNSLIGICVLFVIFQGTVLFLMNYHSDHWKIVIAFVPILFFLGDRLKIDLTHLHSIFEGFFLFTVAYELIQIFLFAAIGRMPALAYNTGHLTDVRFGGAWDDPNGFAILLTFYYPFIIESFRGKKRILYLAAILVLTMLTWSGTGLLCIVASLIFTLLIRISDKKYAKVLLVLSVLGVVAIIAIIVLNPMGITDKINYYLFKKQESVSIHLSGWNLAEVPLLSILGIRPTVVGGEVGIVRLLSFGGIWLVIAFIVLDVVSIVKLNKLCKRTQDSIDRAFLYGAMAYQIAFLLAEFNLPLIYSFSNIGLFTIFVIVSSKVSSIYKDEKELNVWKTQ